MRYLIIGASSGLGRELANKFAKENNNLVLISRDERDLNAIKSDLEIKYNVNVNILSLDFSSLEEVNKKLLSQNNIIENLDGIIFPVGMMFSEDNLNLDTDRMNKLVNANFISIVHTIQKVKKFLLKKNNACIIGFGSVSGYLGRGINTTYAGAKRALESYFESLAFDRELRNINIQFYTLGYLETNLSFGKDLKLPKASVRKLSERVYNNKNLKFEKKYYPSFWQLIHLIIKIIPFSILRKFNLE